MKDKELTELDMKLNELALFAEDNAELGRIMREQVLGYITRIATDDAENEYDEGGRV